MEEWNVGIVGQLRDWPADSTGGALIRRAGVNSFGYGGANAHAIIENSDMHLPPCYGQSARKHAHLRGSRKSYLVPVSSASEDSFGARVLDLAEYVSGRDVDVVDFAQSLGVRRSHMSHRGFVVCQEKNVREALNSDNIVRLPDGTTGVPSPYAFIFTGQGAQWPGMAKELFDEFPPFRRSISEMDEVLKSLAHPPNWSLEQVILEPAATSRIHNPEISQPACTAVQVGLVKLLSTWGIYPAAVIGHSSGEIAAAFAAGSLTAAESIIASYYRGFVLGKRTNDGAMMAAGLSKTLAEVEIEKAGLQKKIRVACVNSPESVTISGNAEAIDTLLQILKEQKTFAKKLVTNGQAYHSHYMLAFGENYQSLVDQAFEKLDEYHCRRTTALWISTVTGNVQNEPADGAYWRSNLEKPVLFADAVERLVKDSKLHFIELGPHSIMEMPIKQIRSSLNLSEDDYSYTAAISRGKDCAESLLKLAGRLYLYGNKVLFKSINDPILGSTKLLSSGSNFAVLHDLPPYRWSYSQTLWNECRASSEFRNRVYARHELLGSQIPGGSRLEIQWRNILRINDVPWLKDHKLGESIVFPAAAYIAMAIEGVTQARGFRTGDKLTYRLRNVNILEALVISVDPTAELELFTTIRPNQITFTTNSKDWWEFSIVSVQRNSSTIRARGLISVARSMAPIQRRCTASTRHMEPVAPRVWYEKLIKEGLNFGPAFQSIKKFLIPRHGEYRCTTEIPLLRKWKEDPDWSLPYTFHPITIDAMLQTAIVATTAGTKRNLRAMVPVSIKSANFETPSEGMGSEQWYIDSIAQITGIGAAETVAELCNGNGNAFAQLKGTRLAPLDAAQQKHTYERHPMLRVLWKPDLLSLGLIPSGQLTAYLDGFVTEAKSDIDDEGLLKMGAMINLLAHKNPRLRVLELANESADITKAALGLLHATRSFKYLSSYTRGMISDDGVLYGYSLNYEDKAAAQSQEPLSKITDERFDLVLLPFAASSDTYLATKLSPIKELLAPNGCLLALSLSTKEVPPTEECFDTIQSELHDGSGSVILAHLGRGNRTEMLAKTESIVIIDRGLNVLSRALASESHERYGRNVSRISLNEVSDETIPVGSTVLCLIESQRPILADSTDLDMVRIRIITNNAACIVWLTSGDLMHGTRPEYALVQGLSRAIMMEQPSLRFYTYDVDNIADQPHRTARNILAVLTQPPETGDFEFVQKNGVVHVSRFVADPELNEAFTVKQGSKAVNATLAEAGPVQLGMEQAGQFDTIHFKQVDIPQDLGRDQVQVKVKAIGLNAKDFYLLGGKTGTKDATCALEYCGIIEKVGADVNSFTIGDRVVVMAPGHFRSHEIVPSWACQKLEDHEDYNIMCTLSFVYSTALYALHERARIQRGESVLIHSGAGGVGIAAIQIAQQAGAEIFTTVSTNEKKKHLIQKFGIKEANIFQSRDSSFLPAIMEATNGRGVDVVLNSLVGDLLHASWECCAAFGRFVEIGKRDILDAGRLGMEQFQKSVTFTAFDLSDFFFHEDPLLHQKWTLLHAEVLTLFRTGKSTSIDPLEVFDVADVAKALRWFSSRNRMGKIAINFEKNESLISVRPHTYQTTFRPQKAYIMIGCLGGIGRSMSKWMLSRGARRFIFLGLSGAEKPAAQRLIKDLNQSGAECLVIKGDVCNITDVSAVVDAAGERIGGVVQAAMGLSESLFMSMSNDQWHKGIDPKVVGTWNLHNAVKDKDIDFFLMTSSISGSVGTATESNYCAGSYFLDVFARHRRSLGLPAVSVGLGMISEVGYLHENPEIEQLLRRKGIQPIQEDELLQIIDCALSSGHNLVSHAYDAYASNHILTGLEPFGLKELRKQGFEGTNPILTDPRAAVLARALDGESSLGPQNQAGDLPSEVAQAMEEGSLMEAAIREHIRKRFSNLVMLPVEKANVSKCLADYGIDSMIAAEFRTWFFQAFKVDVPFLELMGKSVTIESLAETAILKVGAERQGG